MKICYCCVDGNLQKHTGNKRNFNFLSSLINSNLILPLELLPHLSKLGVGTCCRQNVVHDINVNSIQNHNITCGGCIVN